MAAAPNEVEFTFSWLALKLLGRGLYSNPWSALSELVANGIDAGAADVWVYVDARDKGNATVEVIDNGSGMSQADIEIYARVGYDKRKAAALSSQTDKKPKGRKGIGKLAALFLSQHFFLATRHVEGSSWWELDAREGKVADDEHPSLTEVDGCPSTPNDGLWESLPTGTRLMMLGVDLTGYGKEAINALGTRLANQFLLPVSESPRILLRVETADGADQGDYVPVTKSIAFGNLADVVANFPDVSIRPTELAGPLNEVLIQAKGLPDDTYTHTPTRSAMVVDPQQDETWSEVSDDVDLAARTYEGIRFELTGWIGVHASIDKETAQRNDDRFTKNRYYNPAQIRVYVRGKLASDRLLTQLGLTGTYANYIEGEITFDLLDDDGLPDIATSNRQDFDETDNRVTLLRALVRPMVRALIQGRNNLAGTIAGEVKAEKERRDTASKRHFSELLQADLNQHDDISQATRDELQMVITNKIQGDIAPKQSYRVFISHARPDKRFAAFIDELLRSRGARPEEIFFTSRTGATEVLLDDRALRDVVKRNITADNTLLFYMTSKNFLASQFCLFEGGAGWATRGVSEYLKLNLDYESIPGWLTNGKGEAVLLGADGTIVLTPEVHNYLVDGVLNPMIEHLNRGRDIGGEPMIVPFSRGEFPSSVEMSKQGKTLADYFDATIVEHWNAGVDREVAAYLEKYFEPTDDAKHIAQLEKEVAALRDELEAFKK